MNVLMFLVVFVIGGFLAIQAPMNGGLTRNLTKNTYWTVSLGFFLGSLLLLIIILVSGTPFPSLSEQTTQWWHWTGGILGAAYVTITTLSTPNVGATLTMVMVLLGRVIFSTLIDQFGLFGVPAHAGTWPRFLGIALVLVGAVLVGTATSTTTPAKNVNTAPQSTTGGTQS
jgi:transporter family-2 protein